MTPIANDNTMVPPLTEVEEPQKSKGPKRREKPVHASGVVKFIVKALATIVIVFLALFPLLWMFISGFKTRTEVVKTPFQFFPEVWRWENYQALLGDPAFLRTMLITGGGAVVFTIGTLFINSLAAYAFARLEFRGKKFVWPIVLGTMFIPGMTILLTSFIVVTKMEMLDTIWVLLLPGMAAAGHIFFMRQFYLNIPSSLEEAAVVDGCGPWGVYVRIFLPLSKAPFVVVGMGAFMAYWNSFVWPVLTITSTELYQVQQYLAAFRGERASELGLLMAGSALAASPILIIFLIFQKQIIANVKMSGLK